MSLISFTAERERRAIEIVLDQQPLTLGVRQKYYLDDQELQLLGISEGKGTCSDKHGINVAVFGRSSEPFLNNFRLVVPRHCHGAILVRNYGLAPFQETGDPETELVPYRVVEGLVPKNNSGDKVYFQSNHKVEFYVPIE